MSPLIPAALVGLVLTGCTALPPAPPHHGHVPAYGYVMPVEPVELRPMRPHERTVFPLFRDKHATQREFYVDQYGRQYEVDSYNGSHRR